jgi:uncharacterized protein (DUF362 family)
VSEAPSFNNGKHRLIISEVMEELSMVGVVKINDKQDYPRPPFNPSSKYPELSRLPYRHESSKEANEVYEGVRTILHRLGYDSEHYGTADWNPLKELVSAGDKVLIKPNLVSHENNVLKGSNAIVTHASVIRPIIDYVLLAQQNKVEIVIADVPLQEANFEMIIGSNGLRNLIEFYRDRGISITLLDLRQTIAFANAQGFFTNKKKVNGDPRGYAVVDLSQNSELMPLVELGPARFSVGNYEYLEAQNHHTKQISEYCISKTVLESDVVINVPKMKTHAKAGVTLSMKNLIGITGDKSWLPHYRSGSPQKGGDEYSESVAAAIQTSFTRRFQGRSRLLWTVAWAVWQVTKKILRFFGIAQSYRTVGGAWQGNDTLWRTILDVNAILFYADKSGIMSNHPQRKCLSIVDGIVAGEGSGPLKPVPRKAGLLIGGQDPVEVDLVSCRLMGLIWQKIPQIREAISKKHLKFTDLESVAYDFSKNVRTDNQTFEKLRDGSVIYKFEEPYGWQIGIER